MPFGYFGGWASHFTKAGGVEGSFWFIYLVFGVAAMLFSPAAIRWPTIGGAILVAVGLAFAVWWLLPGFPNGFYSLATVIERLFLSTRFGLVGFLFILDRQFNSRQVDMEKPWVLRHLRMILAVGVPTLTALIMFAVNHPTVLTRVDNGDRSARLIEGNGVSLIWAQDQQPVYLWAAEAYDEENAYYVSYTGFVSRQPIN